SWPARCPDFSCSKRNCPPRNASSVTSAAGVLSVLMTSEPGSALFIRGVFFTPTGARFARKRPVSLIGPQFVGEARIDQTLARLAVVILVDQDAARQHAQRPLDDAHVLVQHQMMDIGAVEQRTDRGNQHDIVGPNQFPHVTLSFSPGCGGSARSVNRYLPLPPQPALSIVEQG